MKMFKIIISLLTLPALGLLLVACNKAPDKAGARWTDQANVAHVPAKARWYSEQQVARGNFIFQKNCASCHKADASGTPNWQGQDENGKYPPPPLNGTAHAWHHSLDVLHRVVRKGGVQMGGSMPAFEDTLTDQQVTDALAWVQSNWSDKIYKAWYERNVVKR